MIEMWLPVVGYEDRYEVSNFGHVRVSPHAVIGTPCRILKQHQNSFGYYKVHLYNHIDKSLSVHRLVAIAFVANPNNHPEINHIDGVKANNRADNLEWVTRGMNIKHAYDLNLRAARFGEAHNKAKLTDEIVLAIRANKGRELIETLAARYGVSRSTIHRALSGEFWTHI